MIISRLKNILERLTARGSVVQCPCCNRTARRFFPAGVTNKRPYARCAVCGSLERHRLVALMLQAQPPVNTAKILCIAPEEPLTRFLKQTFQSEITTSDLLRSDVDVQADVCKLPFANESFDVVIANHVLEHVADDQAAMRELRRVTKSGGQAIFQTPIKWQNETTDEDPTTTPAERLRRFGQDDHVRVYGRDIVDRLRCANWKVEMIPVHTRFSSADSNKYGLESDEIFFYIKAE